MTKKESMDRENKTKELYEEIMHQIEKGYYGYEALGALSNALGNVICTICNENEEEVNIYRIINDFNNSVKDCIRINLQENPKYTKGLHNLL